MVMERPTSCAWGWKMDGVGEIESNRLSHYFCPLVSLSRIIPVPFATFRTPYLLLPATSTLLRTYRLSDHLPKLFRVLGERGRTGVGQDQATTRHHPKHRAIDLQVLVQGSRQVTPGRGEFGGVGNDDVESFLAGFARVASVDKDVGLTKRGMAFQVVRPRILHRSLDRQGRAVDSDGFAGTPPGRC